MLEEDKNIITEAVPGAFCSLLLNKGFSVKPLKYTGDKAEVILVAPESLIEIVTLLKMHKETQFSMLFSICGADNTENLEVIYHLFSTTFNNKIILKVQLDKNNPEVNSLTDIFKAADWHERETYDLFGIIFKNHPNLTRILLPNDWKGYPLRKDYKMDDERLAWNDR